MSKRDVSVARVEAEISVQEIWELLVRRKSYVIGFLMTCLAVAIAYLGLVTPLYEARATLRVGQVADAGVLEDPEVLTASLIEKYGEDIATGVKRLPPFLKAVAVQKNSKQVVDLIAYGATPEQAAEFVRGIAENVIARHRQTYDSEVDLARHRVAQIENQRRLLNELFAGSAELLEALKKRDAVQASLLTQERGRIAAELSLTERELPLWLQKLNPPKTVMTELLGEVAAPVRPAYPRRTLILALAGLFGVMGGAMLALAAEFAATAHERKVSV